MVISLESAKKKEEKEDKDTDKETITMLNVTLVENSDTSLEHVQIPVTQPELRNVTIVKKKDIMQEIVLNRDTTTELIKIVFEFVYLKKIKIN